MLKFVLQNKIVTVLFISGILCLITGTYQLFAETPPEEKKVTQLANIKVSKQVNIDQNTKNKSEVPQKTSENQATSTATPNTKNIIKVDVAGAVDFPGVYEVRETARVEEALYQAGGLSASADTEWVSHNMNMAIKLNDGDKIYIPKKGEIKQVAQLVQQGTRAQEDTPQSATPQAPAPQIAGVTTAKAGLQTAPPPKETPKPAQVASPLDAKISINTATSSELDVLPGVGPVTAGKIIANRPYNSLDELKDKKAVNKATFEKIKDKIKL
jgi:competence protein ComEA